jgi:DNA (cytosine-5)-methyltransferase 1
VPSTFQSKALARPVNGVARRLSVEVSRSKTSKPLTPLSDIDKDISIHHPYSGHHVERGRKIKTIQVGDVLSVTKDGEGSVWKDEKTRWKTADDC